MSNKILLAAMVLIVLAMAYVGYDAFVIDHPAPVAKVLHVKGVSSIRRDTDVLPAAVGQLLYQGDSLTTPAKTSLQLQFGDGSMVIMGAGSGLVIDRYDYDVDANLVNAQLRFVKGAIRAVTGRLGMARTINVKAPGATTIGIRGTDVIIANLEPEVLDVLLVETKKSVSVANREGSETLEPGEGTTVRSGQAPTPAKIWPDAKVARALALVAQ